MERLVFAMRITPGQEDEYDRRHERVWPDLERDLTEAGWRNYSLFRRGSDVIAYAECHPDVATAVDAMGESEANARWAEWFRDVLEELVDERGDLIRLREVWHLGGSGSPEDGHLTGNA